MILLDNDKVLESTLCKRRSVRRSQSEARFDILGITPNAHVKFINKSSVVRESSSSVCSSLHDEHTGRKKGGMIR